MAFLTSKKLDYYRWLCQVVCPRQFNGIPTTPPWHSEKDWQEIIYLASIHGVLPHLYQRLRDDSRLPLIPTDVSRALEGFNELNYLFNSQLRNQIEDTTRVLNANGISPVWLKGACQLLLPDWPSSPRTMLDLDLWIPNQQDQTKALQILENEGYYIQPESVGADYSQSQHYAPIIKTGQPARLEVHRHIVSPNCHELLADESAIQCIEWKHHDGLSYGILSKDDQIMQSYLQCTEQATDCMNPRNTPRVMKIVDFLERFSSIKELNDWFASHEVMARPPYEIRSVWFSSLLREYFSITTPMTSDRQYLQRVQFALTLPRVDAVLNIVERGYRLLLDGKLGKVRGWPGKLQRQFAALKNIR